VLPRLRTRLTEALESYRGLTGFVVVSTCAASPEDLGRPFPPAVHPRCIERLRSVSEPAPCAIECRHSTDRSFPVDDLLVLPCSNGLRCQLLAIRLEEHLVGVAKLVTDLHTPETALGHAVAVLRLVLNAACQEVAAEVLSDENRTLRRSVADLRSFLAGDPSVAAGSLGEEPAAGAGVRSPSLVERALVYLDEHHQESELSLRGVASAMGCNPRYLTSEFTKAVGYRMRVHLITLRVASAIRLLLASGQSVKEVAYEAGFSGPGAMGRAFRRYLGVSPVEYRQLFGHR
jgi:AraC-like DNA-binding protein